MAEPRRLGVLYQRLAAFGLLDLVGPRQDPFEIAVGVDQRGRRLDADARDAGHVVGGIAGERLDLDHLVGADAEFLGHLGGADRARADGIEHAHARTHELHHVLVGRDDDHLEAGLAGDARIGGDDVVGLEALDLDARDVEGAGGLADKRELRDQVLGRRRPVGLVIGVDVVAEAGPALVEDDREVPGVATLDDIVHQLDEHVAKPGHGAGGRPVAAAQGGQRVIGAEDVARAVDQVDAARRRRIGARS